MFCIVTFVSKFDFKLAETYTTKKWQAVAIYSNKNALCWNAVVFCVYEIIQLLSVVFCMIRVVCKFDFKLAETYTTKKWQPVAIYSYSNKNVLYWSAVVFCVYEIIQLLSVVFCIIRVVCKFDFKLVVKDTPNKWQLVEFDSCFWQHLCVFPPESRRECSRTLPTLRQVNCILLTKGHYRNPLCHEPVGRHFNVHCKLKLNYDKNYNN